MALKEYNSFLPSPQTRWCTRQLKLCSFERWIRPHLEAGTKVYSYVAIRSDEEYREAPRLPFKETHIDRAGVLDLLDGAGLGMSITSEDRTRMLVLFLSAED